MQIKGRDPLNDFTVAHTEEDRRSREALRCYRPAKQYDFHKSHARELILRGGKRSGKSTGVVAEFASRVLGIPIIGPDNKPLPLKYPVSTPKDPLLYWVIGWDVDHLGQTIHRLLFQSGLFRVIKDKMTGMWRTFNPAEDFDKARFEESLPAEPMIPERFVDTTRGVNGWVWENAGARNFSSVYLKNGAVICAYPSSSKHPKQGDAVSGIWIDEDVQMPGHIKEWQDRLTDKDGWFLWSVWPHSKNFALCDMIDRAEEQQDDPNPDVQQFQLIMSENPFLPKDAKQRALGRMGSDDEIARRDRGELLLDTLAMYDFVTGLHTIFSLPPGEPIPTNVTDVKELLTVLLAKFGRLPHEWTRYLAIDPSHTRTAVLFGVVPPAEFDGVRLGDLCIVERELVVRKHSADMLANAIRPLVEGYHYEAFIMDQMIGRQTRVGEDKTVFQNYSESFIKHGIQSRLNPVGFMPGCNVPSTRYRAVRSMLDLHQGGLPRLLFVDNKTVATQREFYTYRKKQLFIGGEDTILDEPANPRKHDCMAALEYLCSYLEPQFATGCAYMHPEVYSNKGSKAYKRAMEIIKKYNDKTFGEYTHLGPGAAA